MIANSKRKAKEYERGLKMVPMLIHLPPATDDVEGNGRDERDVTEEAISEAQVMYSIIASTVTKGLRSRVYGQRYLSFEIIATEGVINYYAVVPAVLTETIKQAITAAYPTARLEEVKEANIFSAEGGMKAVAGGELSLKEDYVYPIATYVESKRDASVGMINAMSVAKKGDGVAVQILVRPTDGGWTKKVTERIEKVREGDKGGGRGGWGFHIIGDLIEAPFRVPGMHEDGREEKKKVLTSIEMEAVEAMEGKTRYPGFEVLIRVLASSSDKAKSEGLVGGVVSAFAQFDAPQRNGFQYDALGNMDRLTEDYIMRFFPVGSNRTVLNSVELASVFHLPAASAIPTSQVQKQAFKQVDGPARLVEEGVLLGVNEFRGERKEIRLAADDRRRHTYVIGSTGMGKSVLLTNIAYQDMCDGRGFAFIDPHGDAVESLMARVPAERVDDIIYFDPGDMEHPIGLNMFEFNNPDQKDFIIQEGINMLQSLYDPGHTGIFGPRAEHMFRNAALLLMSDPEGGTFVDVPRCFIDPDFVRNKLKYVTDKTVYDYWTKEWPASQRSNENGEVVSWFVSKWGPFLSNTMMRNILGQMKSGFDLREIMDKKKILLVNLSKGKMGELNSKLLGMIFVMKFQTAAMSRADMPEDQRTDFCLFVDEFQNYSTESFETILSEARKYRLNLVVANQFMTQLTEKIREGLLGNVGTILSGRLGVTDAELMEKAFQPTFVAEDLQKLPNYMAVARVMMFSVPSAPFTMALLPPMGEENEELLQTLRAYSATRYGRMRAEVDKEINARLAASEAPVEGVSRAGGMADGDVGVGAVGEAAKGVADDGARRGVASMSVSSSRRVADVPAADVPVAPVSADGGVGESGGGVRNVVSERKQESAGGGGGGASGNVGAGSGAPKSFLDSWLEKKGKVERAITEGVLVKNTTVREDGAKVVTRGVVKNEEKVATTPRMVHEEEFGVLEEGPKPEQTHGVSEEKPKLESIPEVAKKEPELEPTPGVAKRKEDGSEEIGEDEVVKLRKRK